MKSFAIYRLPHASHCTLVEQTQGEPERLSGCQQLNNRSGFVVAPFHISSDHPILLIRPDRIRQMPVEQPDASAEQPAGDGCLRKERKELYEGDFDAFHEQLVTGAFRKIVLARSASLQTDHYQDPMQLFWKACQLYPRLFIALVALPDGSSWLTATPEILLEGVASDWRTIALAGTMQLQGDELRFDAPPFTSHQLRTSLSAPIDIRWSTKNIQEQRYVATYIAQTLERFSIDFKEEGPRTVRAANLVHLRSDFTFTLLNYARVGDLLDALHPTPAVCGLPKEETFRFIMEHEHADRQYYSGFMGPLQLPSTATEGNGVGQTHLYVSLRCMHILPQQYILYAGGGLLKDSLMEQEWQETEAKMQTMRRLLL
ncbi:MAG: chorismate-binding protein [Prevotella sp.]|nr:chorismate-binding protein [Prevotella sp.]